MASQTAGREGRDLAPCYTLPHYAMGGPVTAGILRSPWLRVRYSLADNVTGSYGEGASAVRQLGARHLLRHG